MLTNIKLHYIIKRMLTNIHTNEPSGKFKSQNCGCRIRSSAFGCIQWRALLLFRSTHVDSAILRTANISICWTKQSQLCNCCNLCDDGSRAGFWKALFLNKNGRWDKWKIRGAYVALRPLPSLSPTGNEKHSLSWLYICPPVPMGLIGTFSWWDEMMNLKRYAPCCL